MPHFSSWSWPLEYVGPLDEALTKIAEYEGDVRWEDKMDKAIWRGTPWFNPDWSVGLRPKLVEVTKGKEWADVQIWGQGQDPKNTLTIDEFCKYRYIIYTEVCLLFLFCHSTSPSYLSLCYSSSARAEY